MEFKYENLYISKDSFEINGTKVKKGEILLYCCNKEHDNTYKSGEIGFFSQSGNSIKGDQKDFEKHLLHMMFTEYGYMMDDGTQNELSTRPDLYKKVFEDSMYGFNVIKDTMTEEEKETCRNNVKAPIEELAISYNKKAFLEIEAELIEEIKKKEAEEAAKKNK